MLFSPRKWVTKYFCYEVITQEKASVFCWTDIGLTYSSDPVVTQCWIYSSLVYSRHLHSGAPERSTVCSTQKTVISVPFFYHLYHFYHRGQSVSLILRLETLNTLSLWAGCRDQGGSLHFIWINLCIIHVLLDYPAVIWSICHRGDILFIYYNLWLKKKTKAKGWNAKESKTPY